jgi:4-amino-4-deoxy-L-arabinose transferase-like glycosyltransferase
VTTTKQDSQEPPVSREEPPVSPATAVAWRRRQEKHQDRLQATADDLAAVTPAAVTPAAVTPAAVTPAAVTSPDVVRRSFAESQQAGLAAITSLAATSAPPRLLPSVTPDAPQPEAPAPATSGRLPDGDTQASPEGREARPGQRLARLPGRLSLTAILTVQAILSARLIGSYTAFNDEALYLWAGRLEWSHWLHGTPVPLFQTYFSGAPVIYPPLGAIANSIGGLAGARILSLCFMLGATVLLWSTASRLFDWQTASFAAGLWAVLGATQHLGAYATYDAMSLFLLALAAWCATGRRDKNDATGWILAAAGAMALANATKYASAIFDPVVIGLAIASAWPRPGGKAALRRGTLLTVCTLGSLSLLTRLGGPLYLRGIEQTTLNRTGNTSPALTVLGESWGWVGVVAVIAALAVILSWRRPGMVLTALLAGAILLVPIEQARIHTTTSLNKHVDFGAWFAAIAAGYAIRRIAALPRPRIIRSGIACGCVIGLFALSQVGALQARKMLYGYWPDEARLVSDLQRLTAHGGSFLAEGQYIPAYYLPQTSWQEWANTRSVRISSRYTVTVPVGGQGNPAVYKYLIASHYFSVVLLTFTDTVQLDNDIARDLNETSGYRVADIIPFGPTRHGDYTIWVYAPQARHGVR